MKCKYCGKELDEGSMFCGYCGKQQPMVKSCIKCGKEIGLDDRASVFSEGLAAVKNGKFGFINTKGEEVIPCEYDFASAFSEGLAAVEKNGKFGFINTKGEEVIPCIYGEVVHFSDGFAVVYKDGKEGLVDRFGNSTFDLPH